MITFLNEYLFIDITDDDEDKCKNIECSHIDYYTKELKCPDDSIEVDASSTENECCSIKTKCQCQCKFNLKPDCSKIEHGNYEAVLVRHGNNTPNFCCDLYMCSNYYIFFFFIKFIFYHFNFSIVR